MEELADTIIQDINDAETKLRVIYDKAKLLQTNIKDAMDEEYKKEMNNAKENEKILLNTIEEMKIEESLKLVKIQGLEDVVIKRKRKLKELIKLKEKMKIQNDKDKLTNQRLKDALVDKNKELTKVKFDAEKKTKSISNMVKKLEEELEKNEDKNKEKIKKIEFDVIKRELNKRSNNEKKMSETIKNMKIKNETYELEIQKMTFDDNNKKEKIALLKNTNEALKFFVDNLEKEKDEGIERIGKLERKIKKIKNELTKIKKDDTGKSEHANEAKNKEPIMLSKSKEVMQKTEVKRKRDDINEKISKETMESTYIRLETNKSIRKKIKKENYYEHLISKDDDDCIVLE